MNQWWPDSLTHICVGLNEYMHRSLGLCIYTCIKNKDVMEILCGPSHDVITAMRSATTSRASSWLLRLPAGSSFRPVGLVYGVPVRGLVSGGFMSLLDGWYADLWAATLDVFSRFFGPLPLFMSLDKIKLRLEAFKCYILGTPPWQSLSYNPTIIWSVIESEYDMSALQLALEQVVWKWQWAALACSLPTDVCIGSSGDCIML